MGTFLQETTRIRESISDATDESEVERDLLGDLPKLHTADSVVLASLLKVIVMLDDAPPDVVVSPFGADAFARSCLYTWT
jgi:hypothetical protein